MSEWMERLTDVLATPEISFSRSFYAPGDLSDSAVVITVSRVSADEYKRLAKGSADCQLVLVADADHVRA